MAKTQTPSVQEFMRKTSKAKSSKGCPSPKHTACWQRYKSARRWVSNQIKQIEKHLVKYPNDKQSASRLQSITAKQYSA